MQIAMVRQSVRFWLNDRLVELEGLDPTETLLDFLRLENRLVGTKEGCAEGDCGACTVLVGRLSEGVLVYEAVNACIRFTASLEGCHVVTIEHLRGENSPLHPIQQALAEHHGSQCGFCSPGIVMSLYALWMNEPGAGEEDIIRALQGNLCRCTGYRPIIEAAKSVFGAGGQSADPLVNERARNTSRLNGLCSRERVEIQGSEGKLILPIDVDDLADVCLDNPQATLVGGATDVGLWVTKFMKHLPVMIFTGQIEELRAIAEGDDGVTFGAGVTYSEFWPVILRHFPSLKEFWMRIGGQQVRNMGTIGGNIANGSPIGDTPPVLIALGAAITLRRGKKRRFVRLEDYFISYGKQDREAGEFIESISVPYPDPGDHLAVYKVSKRRDEDISTLCGAFRVCLDADNRVKSIAIVFGGMAEIPKRAVGAEQVLLGSLWKEENVARAAQALGQDFTPLSDVRGSREYRMLCAKNLLRRFYLQTGGEPYEPV